MIKIRTTKKGDAEKYLELRKETFKDYYHSKDPKIKEDKIKKEFGNLLKNSNSVFWVVELDGETVGYLIGTVIKNVWKKVGYLDDIFVSREYRREKIGSKLLKEFIQVLQGKGIKEFRLGVDVQNKKAIGLYKKFGFKITQYEMTKRTK